MHARMNVPSVPEPAPAPVPAPVSVPWHLLPANLGCLADLAEEGLRDAFHAVSLTLTPEGYRVEVTDGQHATRVEGLSDPAAEYPSLSVFQTAPHGATTARVPSADWRAAFRSVPKSKRSPPILRNVAVVLSNTLATLATTDRESSSVRQPCNVEGRFPDFDRVFPPPDAVAASSIRVDGRRLLALLQAAVAFTAEDASAPVTLRIYTDEQPLELLAHSATQRFRAVLMLLS